MLIVPYRPQAAQTLGRHFKLMIMLNVKVSYEGNSKLIYSTVDWIVAILIFCLVYVRILQQTLKITRSTKVLL